MTNDLGTTSTGRQIIRHVGNMPAGFTGVVYNDTGLRNYAAMIGGEFVRGSRAVRWFGNAEAASKVIDKINGEPEAEAPIADAAELEAAAAEAALAKLGVENLYVHTGGLGSTASVHWTIGARRFHVWMSKNDRTPDDTVHSNPVTPSPNCRRDEHRSLDRTCKAQTAIWSVVWAKVARDDLIAKCRVADQVKRDLEQRTRELKARRAELEVAVINAWRAGQLADSSNACELFALDREAANQLAGLNAEAGADREDA